MQNSLISVIIPAYHVEQYIEKCVTSLINQTYRNLEILIACTSEDSTLQVCHVLAAQDFRIRVLVNNHFGVSNARNLALNHAKGDYIAFVDADDWVREDYIESLYQAMRNDSSANGNAKGGSRAQGETEHAGMQNAAVQMAVCGFERVGAERCEQELLYLADKETSRVDEAAMIHMTQTQLLEQVLCNNTVGGYLWNKLFDAGIIRRRKLRFRPELCIGEDMVFLAQYIKNVTGANYLNRVLYSYRTNSESALQKMYTTGSADMTKIESNLRAAAIIRKLYMKECGESADMYRAVHYRLVRTGMWAYFNLLKCGAYDRQALLKIQSMMKGSWLSYCRSPYAKGIEKLVSGVVRMAPCLSFRVLNVVIRKVPDRILKRYVKG